MKYAIVTGASTGIGREVSLELAKNDFEIGLVGRNLDGLIETKEEIEKTGGTAKIYECDLSDIKDITELVEEIKNDRRRIDLIANIAGVWHGKDKVFAGIDFDKFEEKILTETMSVGIIAPMFLVNKLLPLMSDGNVINLSGTFENGGKGWLPYYVSKRAIEDFTIGLADELKEKKIKVNCISPSDTATESYRKICKNN
ncbi:MAG: short chain dehydrogenase [Candidatus Shapirobacteria bacterium GW2011_GWF1_38_23]|nr:MAG: short chain dehydrogenase [Candidatus Shapirobacteria bacterium GW2011_GWF1_38_23]